LHTDRLLKQTCRQNWNLPAAFLQVPAQVQEAAMHRNLLVISALALSLMPVSRCIMEPKLFCSYALSPQHVALVLPE